jgi:hypothetical protein
VERTNKLFPFPIAASSFLEKLVHPARAAEMPTVSSKTTDKTKKAMQQASRVEKDDSRLVESFTVKLSNYLHILNAFVFASIFIIYFCFWNPVMNEKHQWHLYAVIS